MASFSKESTCDNLKTIEIAFRLVEDELPAVKRMAAPADRPNHDLLPGLQ